MELTEIGREGVDWIHLPHERDHWQAIVNTVMNHGGVSLFVSYDLSVFKFHPKNYVRDLIEI
jgi:hypothetical protein